MLVGLPSQEFPPTLLKCDKLWDFEGDKNGYDTAKSHMAASSLGQSCPLLLVQVFHLPSQADAVSAAFMFIKKLFSVEVLKKIKNKN